MELREIETRTESLRYRAGTHKGSKAITADNKADLIEIIIPLLTIISKLFFIPKKIRNAIKNILEVYKQITE